MSIWQISCVDGDDDNRGHSQNAFDWQQMLNNLDLESDSESTNENAIAAAPRSRPTSTTGPARRRASAVGTGAPAKLELLRTSPFDGNTAALPDDGYSSEDEHDSPAEQAAWDSSSTAVVSSPTTTIATKPGGSGSAASTYHGGSDANVPCFFVNGVRHSIEASRKTPDWTVGPSPSAKRVSMELPPWATAHVDPSVKQSNTVVASNDSGVPSAWVCSPKPTSQAPRSQNPPPYATPTTPSSGYLSPFLGATQGPLPPPHGTAANARNAAAAAPHFQTPAVPAAQQASTPFLLGNNHTTAPATFADCPILGFVFMDGEGRLRLASQGHTPPTSAAPAPAAPSAPLSMPPMPHCTPSSAPTQAWRPAAAPATSPPTKPSSAPVGNTKAWVFRDGRWIALSV
ncbi:hypothetical protein NESM_000637000 [Novymonas esmeraldas]|uniref:Uncharacterized protein n=1 Tax=Novymonas esmeraldas TaxID=1808958 RepID=A0AAW0ESB9_9TRYP